MITQRAWRKDAELRKFVIQAHPIIQTYIQKLRIPELIATYIPQDQRAKLPIEQTLCLFIHNILTTPLPMYEIAAWVAALDENCLGLDASELKFIHDDRVGQALERFYHGSVPLVHKIYDGNQTDDRLHPENHQRLRQLLKRSDFIYVADCKLATEENLRRISGCGGRFVSVMPRTWKEDALFRQCVREGKVQWAHLLSRKNNRQPDSKMDRYYLAGGKYQANGYRLLWIQSTQKAEQDAQSRARCLAKALQALKELQTRLNTYRLKSRPAIDQAIRKILQEYHAQDWIESQIDAHRVYQTHYRQRGRPIASQKGSRSWIHHFSLRFGVHQEAMDLQSLTDGVFPLITNLGEEDYPAKRVLEIYKFQPFLEKRHSQIKTWQEVTPVLLKKDERVVAYLHMHVMALMVATLIERQLRKAMKRRGLSSLPLYPEDRPCPYPTLFDIVRVFRGVERYEVLDGERVTLFPAQLNPLHKKLLDLLEVPISLYQ